MIDVSNGLDAKLIGNDDLVTTWHVWAPHRLAMDYCRLGWMPTPALELCATHGEWAVHLVWICPCKPVVPKKNAR